VGLSAGDIAAVDRLYGAPCGLVTLSTTPSGLHLVVDGATVLDGTSFAWAVGSHHTIEGLDVQGTGPIRYVFGSWSDGGLKSHDFVVSADSPVVIANYVRQRQLTPTMSPADAGIVSVYPVSADGYYTERSWIQLTAQPATGFYFLNWSLTPSTGANPKFQIANQPLAVTALFVPSPVTTISSTPPGMTVLVDGIPVSTPRNFAWSPGESHVLSPAEPSADSVRYGLTDWGDGGGPVRTITTTQNPAVYSAAFSVQYRFLLSTTFPVAVTPFSTDGYYDQGSELHIAASPAADSRVSWSGDLSGSVDPAVVTMDTEKCVWGLDMLGAGSPGVTVVNAASLQETGISPGEMVTFYAPGTNANTILTPLRTPSASDGDAVLFDGFRARIVFSSPTQITATVPPEVSGRSATHIVVNWRGDGITQADVPLTTASPGVFTLDGSGTGQAVAYNEDGSVNGPENPAQRESMMTLYATGVSSGGTSVSVRIAGQAVSAAVHPIGRDSQPGLVRIAFQVPPGVIPGSDVSVYVGQGDRISPPGVRIAIR